MTPQSNEIVFCKECGASMQYKHLQRHYEQKSHQHLTPEYNIGNVEERKEGREQAVGLDKESARNCFNFDAGSLYRFGPIPFSQKTN